ncbi:hypothetical protein Hanom_Chr16g01418981 [Helianthus anomalus]
MAASYQLIGCVVFGSILMLITHLIEFTPSNLSNPTYINTHTHTHTTHTHTPASISRSPPPLPP